MYNNTINPNEYVKVNCRKCWNRLVVIKGI